MDTPTAGTGMPGLREAVAYLATVAADVMRHPNETRISVFSVDYGHFRTWLLEVYQP